jgi:hypothetical protein
MLLTRTIVIAAAATFPVLLLSITEAIAQEPEPTNEGEREPAADGTQQQRADVKTTALPPVRADSPSGLFGDRGQIAISSDAGLSLSNTSISGQDGSATSLIIRPAVDWFVIDSLSLGGFVGIEYNSAPGGSSTAMSIGPRVGYNLRFSERFSVWPKIGFSFASTSQKEDDQTLPTGEVIEGSDETSTSLQLNLFVPVMFHPVEHFFLGLGPAFDLDLTGDAKATTIAARLTIGGWL